LNPIIIPNYHVILIHFPLAFLGFGLFVEIFSFLWRRSSFHQTGRWMILLGTLGLIPAATSGIYALYDVASHGAGGGYWSDVKQASGLSDADWREARNHVLWASVATGVMLVVVISWLGGSERWRKGFYIPALLAMLFCMTMLAVSAWHGGELVYRHGFGVEGKQSVLDNSDADTQPSLKDRIDGAISPMQIHLILAGLVIALAAGSLGTSLRRAAVQEDLLLERPPAPDPLPPPVGGSPTPPRISIVEALYSNPSRQRVASFIPARLPVARLWLLASIFAILTIFTGLYVGDYLIWPHVLDIPGLRDALKAVRTPGSRREGLHIFFGASILVILLLTTLIARIAPRKRILVGLLSTLLTLIIAAQVWIGILLLYDTGDGPLMHFK